MRKWPQKWAFIDIGLLGGGLLLSIAYWLYSKNLLPETSPLRDLWLNISTDLLVVWLTTRIIDNSIQSRERRRNNRILIVRNLNLIRSLSQDLFPYFDDWRIRDINRETKWSEEVLFSKLKGYLAYDEQQDVLSALSTAKTIAESATNFMKSSDQREDLWVQIENDNFDYYKLKWLKEPYRMNNILRTKDANNFIETMISQFQKEQSNLPQNLAPKIQVYLTTVRDMATIHSQIDDEIIELDDRIKKATLNILKETEPD